MQKRRVITAILLVAATAAGYWNVAGSGFIDSFDDAEYITQNVHIHQGLTWTGIKWAMTTGYAANWHPITWLSHMIDVELFALNPAGHHIVNLLFHVANSVLLFFVLVRMTSGFWQSAFVAAIFALHPLHVESVAFVAERKDVLSTLFLLSTVWAYVLWTERPTKRRYAAVMVFFTFGLMAKPMLVTLPFILLLLDYWPLRRMFPKRTAKAKARKTSSTANLIPARSLILEKLPLLVLALASSAVTVLVQQQYTAMQSIDVFPISTRIANAVVSYVRYMWKMAWPNDLAFYYPHQGVNLPIWQALVALAILSLITSIVIRERHSKPYLPVGWFWFLGTLLPVIGLVQVGGQAMADRYMYVPMVGLLIIIAWGISDLSARWGQRRMALTVASSVLAVVLIFFTNKQAGYWRDSFTLLKHAVDVTENNWLAHNNLGFAFFRQGKVDEAIRHFDEALRINPNYTQAHINMAILYDTRGQIKQAREHYLAAIRLNNNIPEAHCNVGIGFYREGRNDEAITHYLEALRISPDYVEAHVNLATALVSRGDVDQALNHYDAALKINNNLPEVHYVAAVHYQGRGRIKEAILHYEEALRLNPDYVPAHVNLGSIFYGQQRFHEAVANFEEALRLNPASPEAKSNLAAARAALNK